MCAVRSDEARVWRVELAAERALPSGVTGPWDFFPVGAGSGAAAFGGHGDTSVADGIEGFAGGIL